MADVTTGNAVIFSGPGFTDGIAGATLSPLQSVYLDRTQTPPKWELADADTEATAGVASNEVGITLNAATDGGHVRVAHTGRITSSDTTFTVGEIYVVSTTAGGIAPYSDLTSGDVLTILGVGATATSIDVDVWPTGITLA